MVQLLAISKFSVIGLIGLVLSGVLGMATAFLAPKDNPSERASPNSMTIRS